MAGSAMPGSSCRSPDSARLQTELTDLLGFTEGPDPNAELGWASASFLLSLQDRSCQRRDLWLWQLHGADEPAPCGRSEPGAAGLSTSPGRLPGLPGRAEQQQPARAAGPLLLRDAVQQPGGPQRRVLPAPQVRHGLGLGTPLTPVPGLQPGLFGAEQNESGGNESRSALLPSLSAPRAP